MNLLKFDRPRNELRGNRGKSYCTRSKVSFEILKEEYSQLMVAMKDTLPMGHILIKRL